MSGWDEELFSAKVKAGSRTYFIDVLPAANGAKSSDAASES